MKIVVITNFNTGARDRFENRSPECCFKALENLGYEVIQALGGYYEAWKDGKAHYGIKIEETC